MLNQHLKIERMKNAPKIAFVRNIAISTPDEDISNKEVYKHNLYIPELNLGNAAHQLLNNETGKEWMYHLTNPPMFANGKFVTYQFYDASHEIGSVTIGYIPIPDYEMREGDVIVNSIDPNIL